MAINLDSCSGPAGFEVRNAAIIQFSTVCRHTFMSLSTHMVQETYWKTENICLNVVKILTLIWSSEFLYCVKRLSQLPILEQLIPVYILTFSGSILILYPSYRNYQVLNVRKRTTGKEVGPVSEVGNDSCSRHLLRRQQTMREFNH